MADLAQSWELSLRALNRSPNTVAAYLTSLVQLTDFLAANGYPTRVRAIKKEHIEHWLAELAETRAPATANKRYMALRVFFEWCVSEGELAASPMQQIGAPAIPEKQVAIV